ncbi:MAG TPA: 4Fe-4S binding protein [Deltaproteobacteria bacterium]|nr:4Fe-4S binding protein [Deltaproteobacteria bacterium]
MRLLSFRLADLASVRLFRYLLIMASCLLFFPPFSVVPGLFGAKDFCGALCMRRFFLYQPGLEWADAAVRLSVYPAGVALVFVMAVVTFLFGRLWCAFVCPVGGFSELVSRVLPARFKIEYRVLDQVPIRYGYFTFYVAAMPVLAVSACALCNFLVMPRLFDAASGGSAARAFLLSPVGMTNVALVALLGFLASKGRAYCSLLCPIGAIDALVNRAGATFRFTRRIRVDRGRCTGCTLCADVCMCGAVKMEDSRAVVDQLSCMSCQECVEVCRPGAMEYLVLSPKKRGKAAAAVGAAEAVRAARPGASAPILWRRIWLAVLAGLAALFVYATGADAARKTDPDGCMVCHGVEGLEYLDERGLLRVATIDSDHYYGSIHGALPCSDCHAGLDEYPHDPNKGGVDCSALCHVIEPSTGRRYSHRDVVKEFRRSVHGRGRVDGFTAAGRVEESEEELLPSCRRCHGNVSYMSEAAVERFREAFPDCDRECAHCHGGRSWRGVYTGHVLRRLMGRTVSKDEENRQCDQCHADEAMMEKVEREDEAAGRRRKASRRFVLASKSYAMTLHGKLAAAGSRLAPSCNDCHAPPRRRHEIRSRDDSLSTTHDSNLAKTCAAAGCHAHASSPFAAAFVRSDVHSLDLVAVEPGDLRPGSGRLDSNWLRTGGALAMLAAIIAAAGSAAMARDILGGRRPVSLIGSAAFRKRVLRRGEKGGGR